MPIDKHYVDKTQSRDFTFKTDHNIYIIIYKTCSVFGSKNRKVKKALTLGQVEILQAALRFLAKELMLVILCLPMNLTNIHYSAVRTHKICALKKNHKKLLRFTIIKKCNVGLK